VHKAKKKKQEVSVPKPRILSSGLYFGQLRVKGERVSVSAPTEAEYYLKAKAVKAGLIDVSKTRAGITLGKAIRSYIDSNVNVLSPSTIRGYEIIYNNRFQSYMDKDIQTINYQVMLNAEASSVSPKTISNAWALVAPALENVGFIVPKVRKPTVVATDEDWLDYEQIKIFINSVKGDSVELAALLALHGLRLSELVDLDVSQVSSSCIFIRGASVFDKDNKLVHKDSNKNKTSRRDVPILIPRVLDILPDSGKAVTIHPVTVGRRIKKVCLNAGLPPCSPHDLRRSFASLAFHLGWNAQTTMQVGGWSNMQTVNAVYRKLSQGDRLADVAKMLDFYTK
jgi:integrase